MPIRLFAPALFAAYLQRLWEVMCLAISALGQIPNVPGRDLVWSDGYDGTTSTLLVGEAVPELHMHSVAFSSDGDWASCNMQRDFYPSYEGLEFFVKSGANPYDTKITTN